MDCQADLENPLTVDQAIFTSIRSPMGEGYRLVGCSAGVDGAEKRELTRRSPSHGGLCGSADNAFGWCSYGLPTGRWCVSLSEHAGREHTARGGQRVYTRMVLLDAAAMRRFGCDPSAVIDAMQAVLGPPDLKPPQRLPPLKLPGGGSAGTPGLSADGSAGLPTVLSLALSGVSGVVHGCPEPPAVLRATCRFLPLGLRLARSMSCGLKFSTARRCDLAVVPTMNTTDLRRIPDEFTVCAWPGEPLAAGPFAPWLTFVTRALQDHRGPQAAELAARMEHDCSPGTLQQVAAICLDIEALASADGAAVDRLLIRNAGSAPPGSLQAELLERLRAGAQQRRDALTPDPIAVVSEPGKSG